MAFWNDVDHHSPDQLKRQKSARSKKLTPVSIDKEFGTGIFEGTSKNYNVSLNKCDCVDFAIRKYKFPCKHIYRLAHELGVFDLSDGKQKIISFGLLKSDVPLTVEQIIEQLPRGEARLLKFLLNQVLVKKTGIFHRLHYYEPAATLIKLEIIKEAEETPETALPFYRIYEIKEMLKKRNLPVPTANRWKIIGPLAVEHLGDLLLKNLPQKTSSKLYIINPVFEPIWSALYGSLTKTYPGAYINAEEFVTGNLMAGDTPSLLNYILEYLQEEYALSFSEAQELLNHIADPDRIGNN